MGPRWIRLWDCGYRRQFFFFNKKLGICCNFFKIEVVRLTLYFWSEQFIKFLNIWRHYRLVRIHVDPPALLPPGSAWIRIEYFFLDPDEHWYFNLDKHRPNADPKLVWNDHRGWAAILCFSRKRMPRPLKIRQLVYSIGAVGGTVAFISTVGNCLLSLKYFPPLDYDFSRTSSIEKKNRFTDWT